MFAQRIAENLHAVRERIAAAVANSTHPNRNVQLVAVTKYAQPDWMHALRACGVSDFGESRPQQLRARAEDFRAHDRATHEALPPVRWHQIGQLQRNKVRQILAETTLIHSVDSPRLLAHIERIARETGCRPRLLLQVNISGESAKNGFPPEQLLREATTCLDLERSVVVGLMTMAPRTDDTTLIRRTFAGLRQFRDRLQEQHPQKRELPELSMGMSGDYELAIEEGATIVRVGSRLFLGCEAVP